MVEKARRFDIALRNGFFQPMLVHRLTEVVPQEVATPAHKLPGLHDGSPGRRIAGSEVLDQHLIRQLQGHTDLPQHGQHERIKGHVRPPRGGGVDGGAVVQLGHDATAERTVPATRSAPCRSITAHRRIARSG
ncbi:hypothetical protein D3C73_1212360 [compost metagenome]